jgi:hypothetical protein
VVPLLALESRRNFFSHPLQILPSFLSFYFSSSRQGLLDLLAARFQFSSREKESSAKFFLVCCTGQFSFSFTPWSIFCSC